MRAPRLLAAASVAAGACVLAGCGGGGANVPDGASIAPGNAAAFITLDTSFTSFKLRRALKLVSSFPGGRQALAQAESQLSSKGIDLLRDLRPALGDEVDLVWLDFENNGNDLVGLTKPRDPAKLESLLANADNPPAHTDVDGWTAFARDEATLTRFAQERNSGDGSLSGDSTFKKAFGHLDSGSLVKAYVRGSILQDRLLRSAGSQSIPGFNPASALGKLDSIAAGITPEANGVQLQVSALGDLKGNPPTFHAELPSELPAGALAYASFSNLERSLRAALQSVIAFLPQFDQQRAQLETLLGFSLDKDLLPLFGGEGALAVYPAASGDIPSIVFVLKVSDQAAAQRVLAGIGRLSTIVPRLHVSTSQTGSVQVTQIEVPKKGSVYAALLGDRLVVTNSGPTIETIFGGATKLADDPVFKAAVEGSGLPDETSGFVYANLHSGLPYVLGFVAKRTGQTLSPQARANLAPLRGVLMYTSKSGDGFDFTGFLGIE